VRNLEQRTGLRVALQLEGSLRQLDSDVALGCFRLVEDLLETAGRAGAETAQLTLTATPILLVFSGRVEHVYTAAQHFRLSERAVALGGMLNCSQSEHATVIRLIIPNRENHDRHDSRIAG
jgi:hypothetical protein